MTLEIYLAILIGFSENIRKYRPKLLNNLDIIMADLLEELKDLDEEDENYIFLDKFGNPQLRIELNIHWNLLPNKCILLTCNANESLGYLRFRIGETMEKYPTFSGLSNLTAYNLTSNKVSLPKEGTCGEFTKSGDHISCDITSQDMWIDVRIESINFNLRVQFEVKVNLNLTIDKLKLSLVEIANKLLRAKSLRANYDENDIEFNKIPVDKESLSQDLTAPVLDGSEILKKLIKVDGDKEVSTVFDYLDRYAMCFLNKTKKDRSTYGIDFQPSFMGADSLIRVLDSLPIRGLRVEPTVFSSSMEVKEAEISRKRSFVAKKVPNFCLCNIC
ncbi:unnamed protein product [Blepharisma stoltei]|uniref:Uncharacterized protein n=1 Tax=Blepharisma stoltei TaxID=1481888 RepID=A0AAU9ISG0_9CILI|nr:unnamed protein product [Blepharisma stoltei]